MMAATVVKSELEFQTPEWKALGAFDVILHTLNETDVEDVVMDDLSHMPLDLRLQTVLGLGFGGQRFAIRFAGSEIRVKPLGYIVDPDQPWGEAVEVKVTFNRVTDNSLTSLFIKAIF